MNAEDAAQVFLTAIEDNVRLYGNMFDQTPADGVLDPGIRAVVELWQRVSDTDRDTLRTMLRQTSIDATSTVLGLFDGVALEGFDEEVSVQIGQDDLSGELQNAFLSLTEED